MNKEVAKYDDGEHVSAARAAELLGRSVTWVRDAVKKEGMKPTRKPGVRCVLFSHELVKFLAEKHGITLAKGADGAKPGKVEREKPQEGEYPRTYDGFLDWLRDTFFVGDLDGVMGDYERFTEFSRQHHSKLGRLALNTAEYAFRRCMFEQVQAFLDKGYKGDYSSEEGEELPSVILLRKCMGAIRLPNPDDLWYGGKGGQK